MTRYNRVSRACVATAMLAAVSSPAVAQTVAGNSRSSSDPQSAASSDIIVTARRIEERLLDVPISIAVVSEEEISKRNIVSAADLGTYVPSLSANSRFGPDNASFSIRGFVQDPRTAPSVAVYFADVVAPRVQATTNAGNGAGPGSFFDLQNVQVLRGPQGTLFGRNTTGGAILLVPKKPTYKLEGYVEGSVGNYNMWRVQGVLNVPLADFARLRLGFDRHKRDGYVRSVAGFEPSDFYDTNYTAYRGSLVLDLADNLENYTIVTHNRANTHGFISKIAVCDPVGAGVPVGVLAPLGCEQIARQNARGDGFWEVENGLPDAFQKIRQTQIINTTTFQVSDTLTIKNIASYSQYRQDVQASLFGENFSGPASLSARVNPALAGRQYLAAGQRFTFTKTFLIPGVPNTSQKTFSEELQFQGRSLNGRLTWQAGIYLEIARPLDGFQGSGSFSLISCTNAALYQCNDVLGAVLGQPTGSVSESYSKYRFRNRGIYAQGTYDFSDQFSVTAGLRYTDDRIRAIDRSVLVLFPQPNTPLFRCARTRAAFPGGVVSGCDVPIEVQSDKPTWLINFDYKPNPDMLFYAKYARGYRAGGLNTSASAYGTTWGPEKVEAFEVGAKTAFSGAVRGNLNIAAFYNDFSDQQILTSATAVPPGRAASGVANAGKSTIWGVEVDGSIRPVDPLMLTLSYAYLNTKLKSFVLPPFDPALFTNVVPRALVGGPLPDSPKHKITVSANYSLPVPEDVTVGATYTYTDKFVSAGSGPLAILPSMKNLNLNLNWNSIGDNPIDLSLFVTNVTNEKAYVSSGGTFSSIGFETVVLNAPRMYGMRVRVRFGEESD